MLIRLEKLNLNQNLAGFEPLGKVNTTAASGKLASTRLRTKFAVQPTALPVCSSARRHLSFSSMRGGDDDGNDEIPITMRENPLSPCVFAWSSQNHSSSISSLFAYSINKRLLTNTARVFWRLDVAVGATGSFLKTTVTTTTTTTTSLPLHTGRAVITLCVCVWLKTMNQPREDTAVFASVVVVPASHFVLFISLCVADVSL